MYLLCIGILGMLLILSCSLDPVEEIENQEQDANIEETDVTRGRYGNGTVTNSTNEMMLVFGSYAFEDGGTRILKLRAGRTTPDYFDCDGFYIPRNRRAQSNCLFSSDRGLGPYVLQIRDNQDVIVTFESPDLYRYTCMSLSKIIRGQEPEGWSAVPSIYSYNIPNRYYRYVTSRVCGYFKITVRHNNYVDKVLDVYNAGTARETNVIQWYWNGGYNQHWIVRYESGTYPNVYYSIRAGHCNKYLDVQWGNSSNGSNIWQWDWNGSNAQLWKIEKIYGDRSNMFCKILSKLNTNKCVDVSDCSLADGANIHLWDYVGGNNQKWAFDYRW